jgi:ABC-type glutathione transport system ATPase component
VRELSGGERQRAWFALVLAQEPRVLLLDEPTTFLDLAHQLAALELIARLKQTSGLTVVMALHDLGQAARYAGRVMLMQDGAILADGPPAAVLTAERIRQAYGVEVGCCVPRQAHGDRAVAHLRGSDGAASGRRASTRRPVEGRRVHCKQIQRRGSLPCHCSRFACSAIPSSGRRAGGSRPISSAP